MKQVIFCILGLWKFLWSPWMCTLFINFSDADFIITSWLMKQYTEFSALVICWDDRVTHRSRYELNFELEVGGEVSLVLTPLQSWAQHRVFIKYLLGLVLVMRPLGITHCIIKHWFKKKKSLNQWKHYWVYIFFSREVIDTLKFKYSDLTYASKGLQVIFLLSHLYLNLHFIFIHALTLWM